MGNEWACESCGKKFENKNEAEKHETICKAEGWECEKCAKQFKTQEETEKHEKICSGKKEYTFILQKKEKVLKEAGRVQYAGPTMISFGIGTGLSSNLTQNTGIGTGIFSSKQTKREGSVFDAKPVHIYLTNKRIMFCNADITFFGGVEKSIGMPLSEIYYKNIKGICLSTKLRNPAIDVSVVGQNGIDNIKFWFLGTESARGEERNKFLSLIKKQI